MIGVTDIISKLNDSLNGMFRNSAKDISGVLLATSEARPGMSAQVSYAKILENLNKKGIYIESKNIDGSDNLMNEFIKVIVDEVFRAIKEDANLQITVPIGSLTINASGANAGGPINVTGTNINFGKGYGVIQ